MCKTQLYPLVLTDNRSQAGLPFESLLIYLSGAIMIIFISKSGFVCVCRHLKRVTFLGYLKILF